MAVRHALFALCRGARAFGFALRGCSDLRRVWRFCFGSLFLALASRFAMYSSTQGGGFAGTHFRRLARENEHQTQSVFTGEIFGSDTNNGTRTQQIAFVR